MKDKSRIDYLPLGSVVILKGGVQKIVIISRGLVTAATEPAGFFDYGGCVYPQGIIGDHILYFNHKDIVKVVFSGYSDDDDKMMVDNINEWFQNSDFEYADVSQINSKRKK
ncbi:MAG: DUF4176 domain-containing protein [Lachnospiraceae bacterium]|nr:DUF4176 domain-containing protein [Lachnospiraceae bacterium]